MKWVIQKTYKYFLILTGMDISASYVEIKKQKTKQTNKQ